jgi:hypothetical protein
LGQRGIENLRENTGDMHRSERMLKAGMLGRGIDPAGALELEDPSKALNPGGIDDISLRLFSLDAIGHHDIVVYGVGD